MNIKEQIKRLIIKEAFEEAMKERKSPLSSAEEKIAKHDKPALKNMEKEYGKDKAKGVFYGHVRNLAKKHEEEQPDKEKTLIDKLKPAYKDIVKKYGKDKAKEVFKQYIKKKRETIKN